MLFQVGSNFQPIGISGTYRAGDIGKTFVPADLPAVTGHLEDPLGLMNLVTINSNYTDVWQPIDVIWSGWPPEFGVTTAIETFVPRRGYGLYGYDVTNVMQTIESLTFTTQGHRISAEGTQVVRIYGEALPPPPVYPPVTGDYNENGTVDAADYVVWRELMSRLEGERPNLPNAVAGPRPPIDGDYGIWHYYFAQSVPPIGAAAIPEPASWLLACLALCCVRRHR
jgi:hypothetical protein